MNTGFISVFQNAFEIYEYLCRPICEKAGILQGELGILLFLANNPGKDTAMDIYKNGGMKQSMISTLVERLVEKGFLVREAVPGDRRKVKLVPTEKSDAVVRAGQSAQQRLIALTVAGAASEDLEACWRVMAKVEQNILECRKKMLKGEL